MITGNDLIAWGFKPGPWFKAAIAHANIMKEAGATDAELPALLQSYAPPEPVYIPRRAKGEHLRYHSNIEAENEGDWENINAVHAHMDELMRVPTIKAGAVMPDACPAGQAPGTIPVGGVVACENAIHPGYHSADICCSMAITVLGKVDPKRVLDAAQMVTHFGPGGRSTCPDLQRLSSLALEVGNNPFLNTEQMGSAMRHHFGTQGDGNHFFYVGTLKSTGETAIVTHHGSRKPGALLYKAGMRVAEASTKKIAPSVPKHQSWIVADSEEGQDYWRALQTLRKWTKMNHFMLHDWVGAILGFYGKDRFWNEHNFVFQRTDGLFYHAKGATPAYADFADDYSGLTLIPMNMGEPILIASGLNAPNGLGFAPHGAGRNYSRTAHKAQVDQKIAGGMKYGEATGLSDNIDVRWFSGTPDVSEMPFGYKPASSIRRQIATYNLTRIVDEVLPYGCIMAGEFDWREAGKRLGEMA
jgi:RNA-splicing ligase RtcB